MVRGRPAEDECRTLVLAEGESKVNDDWFDCLAGDFSDGRFCFQDVDGNWANGDHSQKTILQMWRLKPAQCFPWLSSAPFASIIASESGAGPKRRDLVRAAAVAAHAAPIREKFIHILDDVVPFMPEDGKDPAPIEILKLCQCEQPDAQDRIEQNSDGYRRWLRRCVPL